VEQEVGGSRPPNCTIQINNLGCAALINAASGVSLGVTLCNLASTRYFKN
jgi:hypothetical protein